MSAAQEFLEDNMHPTKIIAAYRRALDDIEVFLNEYARTIDPNDDKEMKKMVQSSLGTKFIRFVPTHQRERSEHVGSRSDSPNFCF